jgi:ABC-type transport system involved in cytochrome c biogenesis permease component
MVSRRPDRSEMAASFVAPAWIALMLLTTLIAGSSIVGDRRRGFFELVLVTPMQPRAIIDGTWLAVWEHIRRLYWLPCVLCILFFFLRATTVFGVFCSLCTGTLFLALLMLHGIACSLAARTLAGALVAAYLLPLTAILGTGLLIRMVERDHGPVLWVLCLIALPITTVWVNRRLNPASVGCFLTAVHISLAALLSCWTFLYGREELPISAMHPAYLIVVTLVEKPRNWFGGGYTIGIPTELLWFPAVLCYWSALILNLLWLRSWLLRNFERFVERPKRPAKIAEPTAAKLSAATLAKST